MSEKDKILERILNKVEYPELIDKLTNGLSLSDFNSLQMELFSRITSDIMPNKVLKNYENNPYVKPSIVDPIKYLMLELDFCNYAKEQGIIPIILSPVSLLGSCSSLGSVSQDKILSAARRTEVLSDPTNMMSIYIASGIKKGIFQNDTVGIHMCATHRATRVQPIFRVDQVPHFGLFCMVSSGIDKGSYSFEMDALVKHINFYESFFRLKLKKRITITLQGRAGYSDSTGFFERMEQALYDFLPDLDINIAECDVVNPYYKGINVKIYIYKDGNKIEVGDAGFVDWTQKLLSRKKERMLISAIGLDRLLW